MDIDCSLCEYEREETLQILRCIHDYPQKTKLCGRNTACFGDGKELEAANLHYLL